MTKQYTKKILNTTSPYFPLLLKEREFKVLLLCKEKGWDEVGIKYDTEF
jgi:hypothetical protein